ncbi:MAG TPA: NUDIX hydrolase [Candidatus Saccharibacteria bacterium]|nr:NUDIX hydrolase [Candidatus Saccharibacteria bacterium]
MKQFNVGIKGVVRRKDGAVLLLRKNQDDTFWDVPGGRIDGDESIEQTLNRELSEELPGIQDIRIGKILCAYRLQKDIALDTSLALVYYEVTAVLPDPVQLSDEHNEYCWVSSLDQAALGDGTREALMALFS